MDNKKTVALVGMPNSGKSALFNALTGSHQKVANFPGITVDKKTGTREDFEIIDLPGIYSLDIATLDEKVTRDYLFNKIKDQKINQFILVMDATNLKRSLYLALQLKELKVRFIVALNMCDLAEKRCQKIDITKLSSDLGVTVVETVAVDGKGINDLFSKVKIASELENEDFYVAKDYQSKIKDPIYIKEKFQEIEKILKNITLEKIHSDSFSDKIDNIVLHPIVGPVLLVAVLIFMFQLLFTWAEPMMEGIEFLFEKLSLLTATYVEDEFLKSLITDGIIAGVGSIIVFLPHVTLLFLLILFLEDIGYLGRVAFLLDHMMRRFGLPGKAVVPMLSSHACAVPGIMSARIIENPIERLVAMLVAPVTTCSARLPVYTMLIAAIVPNTKFFGLSLNGLFMTFMYLFGISSAFVISFVFKKAMYNGSPSMLLMELPSYRIPRLKNILRETYYKALIFLQKVGSIIFFLSIIIWALVTFPRAPENATEPAIHYSAAAKIGHFFEPVFRPLGFDWKMTTALVPSFAAREVLVSAMGTVLAVEESDDEEAFSSSLSKIMATQYSIPTLLSLMMWFVFSPQCIATISVLKRETNSLKWPFVFVFYTMGLAYIMAFLTFRVSSLFFN